MKKPKIISGILSICGLLMIMVAVIIINESTSFKQTTNKKILSFTETDVKNIATSTKIYKLENSKQDQTPEEVSLTITPHSEIAEASPKKIVAFDGLTMEEIIQKLNKNLGKDLIANKGELIATYSLSKGIDPFLVTSIMLHETGCKWKCSALVRNCNNVAGQKGTPNCSGGYKGYSSIDEGIKGAIDNLYKNFYSKGLTTISTIGPKYAQSDTWITKITNYYNQIRNN